MNDERPDPDQLLDRLKAEEAKAKRGKLKIFFGASAGPPHSPCIVAFDMTR